MARLTATTIQAAKEAQRDFYLRFQDTVPPLHDVLVHLGADAVAAAQLCIAADETSWMSDTFLVKINESMR